jgi:hypothetical protein
VRTQSIISLIVGLSLIGSIKAQPIVRSLSEISLTGTTLSHFPGYHEQEISIKADCPAGIKLHYTINGSYPDLQSPVFPKQLDADTVMALSVRKEINGRISDTIYTGLYLVKFKSTLPVASLILPSAYFFDPATGIYSGGLRNETERYGNCWSNTEKAVYFEYYPDRTTPMLSQHCGVSIFGGMTRAYPEKSLRLTARKKYGKGKFKGKLFSTKPIQTFNSLILRMSGNDYMATRFQDIMISSLAKDLEIDHMAYQPTVLFLNGVYWGIYNLREKIDREYFKQNHGCEKDSLQLLEGNAYAKYGNSKTYKNLTNYLTVAPPNGKDFIQQVDQYMDLTNFFNYHILQIHIFNVDYRGNIRYWRCPPNNNKFKWIYYDGDLGFNRSNINFLQKRLSETETDWYNPTWSTHILRKLVQNKTLKHRFINQYCYLLSTWLSKDTIISRVNYFQNWIRPEIPRHLTRRNIRQSIKSWEGRVQHLRTFATERQVSFFENLKSVFALKSNYQLQIDANIPVSEFGLFINENLVPNLPYQGQYFGEIPVPVRVEVFNPYYRFKCWSDGQNKSERIIHNSTGQVNKLTAIFEKQSISEFASSLQIQTVHAGSDATNPWIEILRKQEDDEDLDGLLWDVKNKVKHEIRIPFNESLVIAKDTAVWRKSNPGFTGALMQLSDLNCSARHSEFCLIDKDGAVVNYFKFKAPGLSEELPMAYLIHEVDSVVLSINSPDFSKPKEQPLTFWKKTSVRIGLLLSALCLFLFLFIRYRKRALSENNHLKKS